LDTFACLRTFTGHSYSVYTINKLSSDKFVTTSWDCSIKIWSLNESTCLKSIKAGSSDDLIVISDKMIISHRGKSLVIWNVETGENTGEIRINDQFVRSFIKLSSATIATGHVNGSIKIWDIKTQKCLQTIEKVDFSYLAKLSNSLILIGNNSSIQMLDINTGNCIKSLQSQTK